MLRDGQAVANLVTDAHLAALALEYGCELNSTDSDFSRFPGVRWRNPLTSVIGEQDKSSGRGKPRR